MRSFIRSFLLTSAAIWAIETIASANAAAGACHSSGRDTGRRLGLLIRRWWAA